jgi:hypothetical protein
VVLDNCRDHWQKNYAHLAPKKKIKIDDYDNWLNRNKGNNSLTGDEFARYSRRGAAISTTQDPISWWNQHDVEVAFPTLQRWAFDTLACPATSCECERAFSSAKKLITPERNSLADNLIEALECLKAWWDNGFVRRD